MTENIKENKSHLNLKCTIQCTRIYINILKMFERCHKFEFIISGVINWMDGTISTIQFSSAIGAYQVMHKFKTYQNIFIQFNFFFLYYTYFYSFYLINLSKVEENVWRKWRALPKKKIFWANKNQNSFLSMSTVND